MLILLQAARRVMGSLIRCHGLNGRVHLLTLRLPKGCISECGQSKNDEENGWRKQHSVKEVKG